MHVCERVTVPCLASNLRRQAPRSGSTQLQQHISRMVTICTANLTFTILRSAHTVYLWVLCGSENKQRLLSLTELTVFL